MGTWTTPRVVKNFSTPNRRWSGVDNRYSPPIVTNVKRERVCGNPKVAEASTSYVERFNLGLRMGMRRMTRLTNGHSRKVENFGYALNLHYTHYNWCSKHESLNGATPAMANGLTSRVWTTKDLIGLLPAWNRDKEPKITGDFKLTQHRVSACTSPPHSCVHAGSRVPTALGASKEAGVPGPLFGPRLIRGVREQSVLLSLPRPATVVPVRKISRSRFDLVLQIGFRVGPGSGPSRPTSLVARAYPGQAHDVSGGPRASAHPSAPGTGPKA